MYYLLNIFVWLIALLFSIDIKLHHLSKVCWASLTINDWYWSYILKFILSRNEFNQYMDTGLLKYIKENLIKDNSWKDIGEPSPFDLDEKTLSSHSKGHVNIVVICCKV